MGRGEEVGGNLEIRLLMLVVDGPVACDEGETLYLSLAKRLGCAEDYVRQVIGGLRQRQLIEVTYARGAVVSYDLHKRLLRRGMSVWSPTAMLRALVERRDSAGQLSRARYDEFEGENAPTSEEVILTFGSWEAAVAAAGLGSSQPPSAESQTSG